MKLTEAEGRKMLPLKLRQRMFYRALQLHEEGLSIHKIRKKLQEEFGKTVSNSTLSYWLRGLHAPHPKPPQKVLKQIPVLAYVLGAIIGDGYVYYDEKKRRKTIELRVKDKEFADEVAKCLSAVFGRPVSVIYLRGLFVIRTCSTALYEILRKPIEVDRLRPFVEHCNECERAFLRGFFDAEGSVDNDGCVRAYNNNRRLLEYIKELLMKHDIETSDLHVNGRQGEIAVSRTGKVYRGKNPVYNLYIRAHSRLTFYRVVGFTIKRKMERLEEHLRRRRELPPTPNFYLLILIGLPLSAFITIYTFFSSFYF